MKTIVTDMDEIRELEKDFIGGGETKGFKFHQTLASDKGYIYEVESCPSSPHHYEVFRRKVTNSVRMNEDGKLVPVKDKWIVSYPKSNSFGSWAWTCGSEEQALMIYYQKVEKSDDSEEFYDY